MTSLVQSWRKQKLPTGTMSYFTCQFSSRRLGDGSKSIKAARCASCCSGVGFLRPGMLGCDDGQGEAQQVEMQPAKVWRSRAGTAFGSLGWSDSKPK